MSLHLNAALGWILVLVTLALVCFWVPLEEARLGSSYLIFFFHFPSALNCMNFFVFSGICGVLYFLRRGSPRASASWDHWGASAVEVGMLACTVTLVTGGIWARAAWGEWDTWITNDARLLSVYIMWFTYAGYLALRKTIEDAGKRELFCAVFSIIATVNVPVVWFAIRIFGKANHPMAVDFSEVSMVRTRWFGVFAFFILYVALWRLRRRTYAQRHRLDELEMAYGRAGI